MIRLTLKEKQVAASKRAKAEKVRALWEQSPEGKRSLAITAEFSAKWQAELKALQS